MTKKQTVEHNKANKKKNDQALFTIKSREKLWRLSKEIKQISTTSKDKTYIVFFDPALFNTGKANRWEFEKDIEKLMEQIM